MTIIQVAGGRVYYQGWTVQWGKGGSWEWETGVSGLTHSYKTLCAGAYSRWGKRKSTIRFVYLKEFSYECSGVGIVGACPDDEGGGKSGEEGSEVGKRRVSNGGHTVMAVL